MDYFIFDNVDSRDYGIYIVNNNGQPLITNAIPPKTTFYEENNWEHSTRVFNQKYGVREIYITCYLQDTNLSNIRHMVGWLGQLKPKPLVLSTEPYRMYYATFEEQVGVENYGNQGIFTLTFKCYNPFAYSRFLTTDLDSGLNYDSGLYYDSGLLYAEDLPPYAYQNITSQTDVQIYHGGNTNLALPNIKIIGSATDITITHLDDNYSCSYGSFNGTLEINSEYKNVYLDGIMNNKTFSGEFITLNGKVKQNDTGINNIRISGTDLNLASVSFEFRYVYL